MDDYIINEGNTMRGDIKNNTENKSDICEICRHYKGVKSIDISSVYVNSYILRWVCLTCKAKIEEKQAKEYSAAYNGKNNYRSIGDSNNNFHDGSNKILDINLDDTDEEYKLLTESKSNKCILF